MGYMSVVGDQLGSRFAATLAADDHGRQPHAEPWSADRLGAVLVDIERRIGGGFRSEVDGQGDLVLVNDRCPFGPDVVGRPSLCMVTSGVFGRIAAERFGHVSVEIAESIARGDGRCVVRVAAHPDLELGDTTRHYFADS
jgi:predicted ArsR family transcriptional regulator